MRTLADILFKTIASADQENKPKRADEVRVFYLEISCVWKMTKNTLDEVEYINSRLFVQGNRTNVGVDQPRLSINEVMDQLGVILDTEQRLFRERFPGTTDSTVDANVNEIEHLMQSLQSSEDNEVEVTAHEANESNDENELKEQMKKVAEIESWLRLPTEENSQHLFVNGETEHQAAENNKLSNNELSNGKSFFLFR